MSNNTTKVNNPMKVITGKDTRWSYANVWEAKSINGGTPKFSVSLIIPKSDTATVQKIKAAIEAAYHEGEAKLKGNGKSVPALSITVGRFPKLLQTAIGNATSLITGQSGGYVVLHGDENGQPYELLILDAPNINDAVNVWRWNVGGLGFSHNGYNGPYETAITADGQIVADFITSGSLVANIIKAGVIQSQDGSSYWDLETGEVVLRAYATSKEVTEVSDRVTEIEEQKMYRLVITSSNGNIFKNGNIATTLSAEVYSWDENITDSLDPNQFVWTRVSEDADSDRLWNAAHYGGAMKIYITTEDVKVRATFFCDLIDTTTRNSLL